jgi:magnesium transporter
MSNQNKRKNKKPPGLPPGTIVFTGEQRVAHPDIFFTQYAENECIEEKYQNYSLLQLKQSVADSVLWYDVCGLHDVPLLESFGQHFDVHNLVLEDIANTNQRPKIEEYSTGIFILAQAFSFDTQKLTFTSEQIALYLGDGFLLSFQEDAEDLFISVRQQILNAKSKLRRKKSDYLAYLLLDTIVDNYIEVLDTIEDEIVKLETEIMVHPHESIKSRIYHLKREGSNFRKSVAALREAIARLAKADSVYIQESTAIFIRDLQDHIAQVLERCENNREMLTELQNLYVSEISFKMNNVIQVLTIVSSVFIPITFIAGVYGMNFEGMPELKHPYGYPAVWGLMLTVAFGSLAYFRYKRWLSFG